MAQQFNGGDYYQKATSTNKKEEGRLTYAQLRTKVEVQAALLRSFEGCAESSSSWT